MYFQKDIKLKRKILLFDTSSVLHAAKHSLGKSMLSKDDKYTFVIYGFMLKLHAIFTKEYYDIVIFALDSKSSVRKDFYSEYKENRSKAKKTAEQIKLDELARPQFKEVIDYLLPTLGYKNRFIAEGLEADDVIASICHKYRKDEIAIISTDKDLYQLITNNIYILDSRTHYTLNINDFRKKYNIEPKMWKRVKAYGGCVTDNVKGLPIPQSDEAIKKGTKQRHIGEKNALNYIHNKIGTHTLAYKAFTQPSAKSIIIRNKRLTLLPHRGTPEFNVLPDNRMSKKGLKQIIDKYAFKSIKYDMQSYCKAFRLK